MNQDNKLNNNVVTVFWRSIKFELNVLRAFLKWLMHSVSFWKWETTNLKLGTSHNFIIQHKGAKESVPVIKSLLGAVPSETAVKGSTDQSIISVYDFPVPRTLRIPFYLTTIVKLDKSVEDIMGRYSRSLRRSVAKQSVNFRYEKVTKERYIDEINTTMLQPYATERHDLAANQLEDDLVKRMAYASYGQLDFLYRGTEKVGCHLGNSYVRKGKQYWHLNRFGYIKDVFSDSKRLNEANSSNLHLALLSSIDNGYDFCDYGMSLAKPGSGLIEWKRRRKGFLAKSGEESFFLKLPQSNIAMFFWESPLFSLECSHVCLHLGLPDGKTDAEIAECYNEMGYDGLRKVYLYCTQPPNENVIQIIQGLYQDLSFKPDLITKIVK